MSSKKARARRKSKRAARLARAEDQAASSISSGKHDRVRSEPDEKAEQQRPREREARDKHNADFVFGVGPHKYMDSLLNSGWVQNTVVGLFLACIIAVGGFFVRTPKSITLLCAVVLTLIVWFLAYLIIEHFNQKEAREFARDLLIPGNETAQIPIPRGRPNGVPDSALRPAKGEIVILLGDLAVSTAEPAFTVLRLYGKDLLKLKRVGHRFRISADVWGEDGRILATIDDSEIRVNRNNTLPILRPDAHTLFVDDEKKNRVLSVRFLNPNTIKIAGIFRAGGKYSVLVGEHDITFGPLFIFQGIAFHLKGEAIFDWPGNIGTNKPFLAPTNEIPDKASFRFAKTNGAVNLIVKDARGDEYSIFQVGGHSAPPDYEIWPSIGFQLRKMDSY